MLESGQMKGRCSVCGERRPCVLVKGERICLECAQRLGLLNDELDSGAEETPEE